MRSSADGFLFGFFRHQSFIVFRQTVDIRTLITEIRKGRFSCPCGIRYDTVRYGTVRYGTVRCVGVLSVNNYRYIRANSYSLIKYTIVGKLSNVLVHFKNEDCLSLPTPSKCSIIQWLMSQGQLVKINGSF